MKIIVVDKNHQFRLIPDSALLLKNRPLFCPDYVQALHAKIALVVKINRLGKYIQEKFAPTYYDEIGFVINFYDKKCLDELVEKGLPWERATCFDGSFALSEFVKISEIVDDFVIVRANNYSPQQTFSINLITQTIPSVISELSTYMTLKIGDYIAIELDEISTPIALNDTLQLSLGDKEMIKVVVK